LVSAGMAVTRMIGSLRIEPLSHALALMIAITRVLRPNVRVVEEMRDILVQVDFDAWAPVGPSHRIERQPAIYEMRGVDAGFLCLEKPTELPQPELA